MSLAHRSTRLTLAAAFAMLTLSVPAGLAQKPVASPVAGDGPHPAHIHAGTCAELGDVVAPLNDVVDPSTGGGEQVGAPSAQPVKVGATIVDMPLEEIIAGGHAINVHLSAEDIGEYIACGDIGGVVVTDYDDRSELNIGLQELNDSGHVGTVWLGADGDQTIIEIILIEPDGLD